jgi:serine O-acetyltransferase
VIGNRVVIGPGAVVIGNVRVGDDVTIGAGAVVMTNVPPGAVISPILAQVVEGRDAPPSEDTPAPSVRSLWRALRSDLWANGGTFWSPGFQVIAPHRIRHWLAARPGFSARLADRVLRTWEARSRRAQQIDLPYSVNLGDQVRLSSKGRIRIAEGSEIGEGASFGEDVVVGWNDRSPGHPGSVRIGPGAQIRSGAVIGAGVQIGKGATIGFNAIVMNDVPAGAFAEASAPKLLRAMATAG